MSMSMSMYYDPVQLGSDILSLCVLIYSKSLQKDN